MGFLSGFVEGSADAVAKIGEMELIKKAEREKAEADAVRRQALAEYEQGREDDRQERKFNWESEQNSLTREHEAEQKKLDRESEERRSRSKGSAIKPVKIGEDDMGNPIYGVFNPDSGEIEPVNVSGSGGQPKVSLEQAQEMARREANDKAGFFSSDKSDFGGSREEWINRRSMEIMNGAGGGSGSSTESAPAKPSPQNTSTPSFSEYAAKARAANPGVDIPESELKARYQQRFGGTQKPAAEKPSGKDPQPSKAAASQKEPKKAAPAEKSPRERLAEIEDRLRSDEELKSQGSGGIVTRFIRARQFPLGLAERRTLEAERDRLRKQLGVK